MADDRRHSTVTDDSCPSLCDDDNDTSTMSSRAGSISSLASSTDSTCPLTKEKTQLKVPLYVAALLANQGFNVSESGMVSWRLNSQAHPRNWSPARKTYDASVIIFLEFFMTLVSNTGSSVAEAALNDLGVSREVALLGFTTSYLVGQAIGGLFLPPFAETFGGRTLYIAGTVMFTISCVAIAAAQSMPAIIIGRFVCGLASALPVIVAVSSFENMFGSRTRTWILHVWMAGAVAALGIGPVVATYISTSNMRWPWVFTTAAIVSGCTTILCLVMKESRPSRVLHEHIQRVRRSSGFQGLSYESTDKVPDFSTFCQTLLLLPLRLFFTEPTVFLTSVMAATVTSVIYVFPEVLPIVYRESYDFTPRQCSLVMLAISAGVTLTFLPRLYDMHVSNRQRRNNTPAQPEDKLFGFLIAAPLLAVAFWWFAYTVPPLHAVMSPWASIPSLGLIGFSVVEFDAVLAGYLTDTYTSHAASANAPLSFLRAMLCGVCPVFGQRAFSSLGTGRAMIGLASMATAYVGIAIGFAVWGKRIRERSWFVRESQV